MNGSLAEAVIWDAALTDAEALMLGRGLSPLLVRPDNIQSYAPLYGIASPEPDICGTPRVFTLTNAPTHGAHPPLFMPQLPIIGNIVPAVAPPTPDPATLRTVHSGMVW
jgi:hypothetical protein